MTSKEVTVEQVKLSNYRKYYQNTSLLYYILQYNYKNRIYNNLYIVFRK